HGYTYIAKSTAGDLDLRPLYTDTSTVRILHTRINGDQHSADVTQIDRYQSIPLSVQLTKNDGYKGIQNTNMSPYMFVGFLPKGEASQKTEQGWKVEGTEFKFKNCDANPNSYFAVLFNGANTGYTRYPGSYNSRQFAWKNLAKAVANGQKLTDNFLSEFYEIHFGGCGGYSTGAMDSDVKGVAVGLKFEITHCAVPCAIVNGQVSITGNKINDIATYECNKGYAMISGDVTRTCMGNGGWSGAPPTCMQENCVTLQNAKNGQLQSGFQDITRNGETFKVYCEYKDGEGYVFIDPGKLPASSIDMLSLYDDSTHVRVVHLRNMDRGNNPQYEARMQQLPAFASLPVSVQLNANVGYKNILNQGMGPYLYMGFIPKSNNRIRDTQGWRVNGNDFTFINCDGNQNSYFAILYNKKKTSYNGYRHPDRPIMFAWYDLATTVETPLPQKLFTEEYEIHHGGCGGYSISLNKPDVKGVTAGFRFTVTCAQPVDVVYASKTVTGLIPGSTVVYSCSGGRSIVSGDGVRTCTPTGGWSGQLPTCG
ncbi:uncharacterized protein LOC128208409, partial [Mya arenaria]|uniref:uncharacterized protein LOC128208409 n=1 Tax=Mya arenaria TaxID=6604 RepID=UPI0022E727D8